MKTQTADPEFKSLPRDYTALCREVWLPRPIRDKADHQAALDALAPMWGHENELSTDQAEWFSLVADLAGKWEDAQPEIVYAKVADVKRGGERVGDCADTFCEELLGLLRAAQERLTRQESDIEEAMKPRPAPIKDEATRKRIKDMADAALERLRARGFLDQAAEKPIKLNLSQRLAGLLEAHSLTAADFGRLLELEPSMGSKIINGTRQLTAAHIRRLSAHFALPAEYFL